MNEEKDTFNFSYSAKQQEEIRKIREKYIPKEEKQNSSLSPVLSSVWLGLPS